MYYNRGVRICPVAAGPHLVRKIGHKGSPPAMCELQTERRWLQSAVPLRVKVRVRATRNDHVPAGGGTSSCRAPLLDSAGCGPEADQGARSGSGDAD